ncbi:MAG: hypothetical protein HYV09_18245 [Deltaproteobacteria bacterium]|nr:hypothetical protein [Deltaproteobacteria bacterium]
MRLGFDAQETVALVVHGYALDGLTWAQCATLADAVARLGPPLVAAPNGDLSDTGSPSAATPDEACVFTFVVGALVAMARVEADQAAESERATVDEARCVVAKSVFEATRTQVDEALARVGATAAKAPGTFLLAAGPLATASLRGDGVSEITRVYETGERESFADALDVSWDADPDAVRVELRGRSILTARYD